MFDPKTAFFVFIPQVANILSVSTKLYDLSNLENLENQADVRSMITTGSVRRYLIHHENTRCMHGCNNVLKLIRGNRCCEKSRCRTFGLTYMYNTHIHIAYRVSVP